jgi:putative SOS response-associated peptidase YedK
MCNHYANDLRKLGQLLGGVLGEQFSEKRIPLRFGNLPLHVYPDRMGLVVRREQGGLALETMRWGFPSPKPGGPHVTNVRNTEKPFWRKWLEPEHRCLVPVTAFAEYGQETPKREFWFARPDEGSFFFAGIWRQWEGERGPKKAPEVGAHLLFAFLTTEPNSVVAPIHPKAMPVMLGEEEADFWLTAPWDAASSLQEPAPDDALVIVDGPSER